MASTCVCTDTVAKMGLANNGAVFVRPSGIAGSRFCVRARSTGALGPVHQTIPQWLHDWNRRAQDPNVDHDSEVIRPRKIYRDPYGRPDEILVLYDAYNSGGAPIPLNKRHDAVMTMNHPDVAPEQPRFQMQQDFILMPKGCSGPQGPRYWDFDKHAILSEAVIHVIQEISENGARAGIQGGSASGIFLANNAWTARYIMEGDGISLADDVWILRYIAEMVASKYELVVFDPNMIPGYDMEAGIRMKFSTQSMRNARGYEEAKRAVDKLEMMHALSGEGNGEFKILPYFDAPAEADGRARPSGFVIDIRMPPSHEMDPYVITSRIARTARLWKPTFPEIIAAKYHTDPFLRAVRSTWSKLKRLRTC